MSKIFFLGDNHSDFRHILQAVERDRPDAIVFLGDIEAKRPLEVELESIIGKTEIRFIHGNHDTDAIDTYNNLIHSSLAPLNLDGRVDTVAGVRIAGLGGIFRTKIWRPWETKHFENYVAFTQDLDAKVRNGAVSGKVAATMRLNHASSIFPEVYDTLATLKADVLVTHEAPSCHPYGFDAIDLLAQSLGVKKVFHGHQHDRLDYRPLWDRLGFEAHGVGLRGITDLDGNVIVTGELDEERMSRALRGSY